MTDIETAIKTTPWHRTHISVGVDDLQDLFKERALLREQVTALQAASTLHVEASLTRQVRAFHLKFGHPIANFPAVPDDAQVRFRLALIAEEFMELLAAAADNTAEEQVEWLGAQLSAFVRDAPLIVDLPEFTDAMADLDYVVEGTRAVFGIYGPPIAREVQRANMDKDAVQVAEADSAKRGERIKPVKPAGWRGPDVVGELRRQGWLG